MQAPKDHYIFKFYKGKDANGVTQFEEKLKWKTK
jgi:hypothetical protein